MFYKTVEPIRQFKISFNIQGVFFCPTPLFLTKSQRFDTFSKWINHEKDCQPRSMPAPVLPAWLPGDDLLELFEPGFLTGQVYCTQQLLHGLRGAVRRGWKRG